MCKQDVALQMLKKRADKSGLSEDVLFLAEKQVEDFKDMNEKLNNLSNKVEKIEDKIDVLTQSLEELKEMSRKNHDFFTNFKEVISNKVFIYLLVTLLTLLFGVPVAQNGFGVLLQ